MAFLSSRIAGLGFAACALVVVASAAWAATPPAPATAAFAAAAVKAAKPGDPTVLAALTAPQITPQDTQARLLAYLAQAPSPVTGAVGVAPPPASLAVSGTPAAGAATPDKAAVDAMLALQAADSQAPLPTQGLSSGQAIHPFMPTADDFDHQAAQAIVSAFSDKKGQTADDAAADAAAQAPDDPAFDERVGLATTLFQVDGTDAVIRHYVDTEHMKLIITEVGNHIDISKLSVNDKYRLAAIAAVAQTELEDRIIGMNARVQAANLSKDELMQLIAAYDTDAQRKQTQLRLHDDGKQDTLAGIDVIIAEYDILRTFIADN